MRERRISEAVGADQDVAFVVTNGKDLKWKDVNNTFECCPFWWVPFLIHLKDFLIEFCLIVIVLWSGGKIFRVLNWTGVWFLTFSTWCKKQPQGGKMSQLLLTRLFEVFLQFWNLFCCDFLAVTFLLWLFLLWLFWIAVCLALVPGQFPNCSLLPFAEGKRTGGEKSTKSPFWTRSTTYACNCRFCKN